MKLEVKELWVAALRERSQTKHHLRDATGFCCWGVLCDLSRLGEWQEPDDASSDAWTYVIVADDDEPDPTFDYDDRVEYATAMPPRAVLQWAGLESDSQGLVTDQRSGEAADLNDDGVSFEQIAKAIEEQW